MLKQFNLLKKFMAKDMKAQADELGELVEKRVSGNLEFSDLVSSGKPAM